MYKNLALSGGGMRGFAYVGALKVLDEHTNSDGTTILDDIERVSGSSVGALFATLVALDYNIEDLHDAVMKVELDPGKHEASNTTIRGQTINLFEHLGRYDSSVFYTPLKELLSYKHNYSEFTFRDLHNLQNESNVGHHYKDLYITGTDLTDNKALVFSHEETPDMKLIDAIRISMSYPPLIEPYKSTNGHLLVDGGLLNNYPISIFNAEQYNHGYTEAHNPETLGMLLKPGDDTISARSSTSQTLKVMESFDNMDAQVIEQYLNNPSFNEQTLAFQAYLMEVTAQFVNSSKISLEHDDMISIPVPTDINNFNIDSVAKSNLADIGYEITSEYLANHHLI